MLSFSIFLLWIFGYLSFSQAVQIIPCPTRGLGTGSYYISDDLNRCIFYWCWEGNVVQNSNGATSFQCPGNLGTRPGYHGRTSPCTEQGVTDCFPDGSGITTTQTSTITTASTTTTQQSSTTDSSTTKQMRDIPRVFPNMHARGGVLQGGITELFDCFLSCRASDTCYAFDFNVIDRTCYFHTKETACDDVRRKDSCAHYRLFDCEIDSGEVTTPANTTVATPLASTTGFVTTTIPATTTTQTNPEIPQFIQTFRGYHLLNGVPVAGDFDAYGCLMACVQNALCEGVDFDNRTNQCFFHNQQTECAQFVQKPFCTHYRLFEDCPASTQSPTSSTTTDMSEEVTDSPIEVPGGFVSVTEGVHIFDALLIDTDVTEQQCLDACLAFGSCLAVDYNIATRECFAHNTTSYCMEPTPKPFCRHYKRAPCIEGANNDIVEVRGKFHTLGGSEICTDCSAEDCLIMCATDFASVCQGVDYDERNRGCYMHTAATICGIMRSKDFCTHYSRVVCSPTPPPPVTALPRSTTDSAAGGYPAPPNTDFMVINFIGPSADPTVIQTPSTRTVHFNTPATFTQHSPTTYRTRPPDILSQQTITPLTNTLFTNAIPLRPSTMPVSNSIVSSTTTVPTLLDFGSMENSTDFQTMENSMTASHTSINTTIQSMPSFRPQTMPSVVSQQTVPSMISRTLPRRTFTPSPQTTETITTTGTLPTTTPNIFTTTMETQSTTDTQITITNAPIIVFDPLDAVLMEAMISVIPSMWNIYPGMYMAGGTPIAGPSATGDQCVAACEANPLCVAVDFNSEDGLCEGHLDANNKCQILSPLSGFYHLKKPPVCEFFAGTPIAYPTPFSVAP